MTMYGMICICIMYRYMCLYFEPSKIMKQWNAYEATLNHLRVNETDLRCQIMIHCNPHKYCKWVFVSVDRFTVRKSSHNGNKFDKINECGNFHGTQYDEIIYKAKKHESHNEYSSPGISLRLIFLSFVHFP